MSERYQRATDILELKDLLQSTLVGLTMDDVAEHFEVSRRTAERMVGALRDRFLDVRAETREGRKYWSLRTAAGTEPDGLPHDLQELSQQIQRANATGRKLDPIGGDLREGADDLLKNSAVGIFLMDVDFRVVWMSLAMERYFGIDKKDVVGNDMRKLIHEVIRDRLEDPRRFEERILTTYKDNTYIEHYRCHVLPGEGREERWLEHWSQPINTGPFSGGRVEHYVDVTESVRCESARWRELRALRGRFQDADESVKAEGVASAIAHSIVDPLTDILAIANNPENQGTCTLRTDALEEISGLATRIGESLDKLLELTKSERPVFECLKAWPILSSVTEAALPSAKQSGVEIEWAVSSNLEGFEFEADPRLLECALDELLKNAIEAMPNGGTLSLAAERSEECAQILFHVSDTGSGIRHNMRRRVFAPFYTTRKNATGLGLGIARSVADLHGGEIEIGTASSGGARVCLKFPIERE